MKQLNTLGRVFFGELGFRDAGDYFSTIFGFKGMIAVVSVQWVAAAAMGLMAFIGNYVWAETNAFLALTLVIILDARYGFLVAKKIRGEKFLLPKFWRTISILIAHFSQLVILTLLVKDYEYAKYFAHTVFWGLFFSKFKSLSLHYGLLKLQNGDVPNMLKAAFENFLKRFLTTQDAAALIDARQDRYPGGQPIPAPVPLPEPEPEDLKPL